MMELTISEKAKQFYLTYQGATKGTFISLEFKTAEELLTQVLCNPLAKTYSLLPKASTSRM
jgi:hypothetical protein